MSAVTLRNGAEVIAQMPLGDRMYVAAKWHGAHPYVTWAVDDDGNAYWGKYFATQEEAISNLWERAAA